MLPTVLSAMELFWNGYPSTLPLCHASHNVIAVKLFWAGHPSSLPLCHTSRSVSSWLSLCTCHPCPSAIHPTVYLAVWVCVPVILAPLPYTPKCDQQLNCFGQRGNDERCFIIAPLPYIPQCDQHWSCFWIGMIKLWVILSWPFYTWREKWFLSCYDNFIWFLLIKMHLNSSGQETHKDFARQKWSWNLVVPYFWP